MSTAYQKERNPVRFNHHDQENLKKALDTLVQYIYTNKESWDLSEEDFQSLIDAAQNAYAERKAESIISDSFAIILDTITDCLYDSLQSISNPKSKSNLVYLKHTNRSLSNG